LAKHDSDGTGSTSLGFARCDPDWLALGLSGRALRVLLALSLHADWSRGFGRCLPHRETIASLTRLQASHVSEAIKELAQKHRLITVVRIGRKNVYYIREIGAGGHMPPSDPASFFAYLGKLGIRFHRTTLPLGIRYLAERRRLEEHPRVLIRILEDYLTGSTAPTLERWISKRGRF
jgi:hypothetical protein